MARSKDDALEALKAFALSLPEAYEDHPWGETVAKVKGKVFVFLGKGDDGLGLSVKLPESGLQALSLPFAKPTAYGLGKSGWVSAQFGKRDAIPLPLLRAWIAESYGAIAPRKLVAALGAAAPPAAKEKKPKAAKKTAAPKPRPRG